MANHKREEDQCEKPKKMIWPLSTIYNKVVSLFNLAKDILKAVVMLREDQESQFNHVNRHLHKIEQRLDRIEGAPSQDDADLAAAARAAIPIINKVVKDLDKYTPNAAKKP